MTVTNLNAAPAIDDQVAALVGRVFHEIAEASRKPDLSAVHEVIREAGIRNARRALAEAPDRLAEAQNLFREAQAVEAAAKQSYGQALIEAEWSLDGQLHKDGNKTYRWVICECTVGTPENTGEPIPGCAICAGDGKFRRFMLADDVKSWKAAEAAKVPAVVTAALDLREAEEASATARDAVGVADRRFSAAKYDLQAAVAELNALAVGLSAKGA
jgi:hypothetical protein